MKKIKHPVRTVLLTTLLATMSVVGGCWACKKRTPTPEELWKQVEEAERERKIGVNFDKKNKVYPQKKSSGYRKERDI